MDSGVRADDQPSVFAVLRGAGVQVDGVADGDEVVPGVRLASAPGPPIAARLLEILGRSRAGFVFLADVIHAREHVAQPEWDFLHDSDPVVGLATRRGMLRELAGSGATVACSHVDSFGRIDAGPVWVDVA